MTSLGNQSNLQVIFWFARCPVVLGRNSQLCRLLRDRGLLSRRLKLASFGLTVSPLSQAWPLGGLPRAAPVPFRGSSFTSGLHPPDATPQRLIVYLDRKSTRLNSSHLG